MFNTGTVKGTWTGTVYIRADGSIDPPDAPITTYDNITYTLTDNITSIAHGIVVERDNIIIDGGGYTVEGTRAYPSIGIALPNRINVTIKDINVKNFDYGLYLYFSSNNNVAGNKIEAHKYGGVGLYLLCSSNNSIIGNVIANSYDGMRLEGSSNNTIFGNHVTANYNYGIYLYPQLYPTTIISSNNIIYANNVTNNKEGIRIEGSINNVIYANNVTNNDYGIVLGSSSYNVITGNNIVNNGLGVDSARGQLRRKNIIYHNNFINNTIQARDNKSYLDWLWGIGPPPDIWNDDYPSGGNYWSDYTGTDNNGDGIGDTPYIIGSFGDRYVEDRYPLMSPWTPVLPVNITFIVPDDYPTIQEAINAANEGDIIYVRFGTYRENIVLNKSLTIIGEDRYITVISGNEGSIVNITANNANLTGFTIKGGEVGIIVLDVLNVTINKNRVLNNLYGLAVVNSTQCTITYNILFNNTFIGLSLTNSTQSQVVSNTITNNGNGIALAFSLNNNISQNIVTANYAIGMMLGYSNNNTISQNYIIGNIYNSGLQLVNSTNNVISANTMEENKYGVGFQESSNNIFYHNNFLHNDWQVYDASRDYSDVSPSINVWDDGYPSGGNYWSDYSGVDLYSGPYQNETGGDGIVDTPYFIGANNVDKYPLMSLWSPIPLKIFDVVCEGTHYSVSVQSNSTVTHFIFNQALAQISFNVSGISGTWGFCNITIPKALMTGPWTYTFQGDVINIDVYEKDNETHTFINIQYKHASTFQVIIKASWVIPEYPSTPILISLIPITLTAATLWKTKRKRQPP
jgi:parallel beta-helix repeat protein